MRQDQTARSQPTSVDVARRGRLLWLVVFLGLSSSSHTLAAQNPVLWVWSGNVTESSATVKAKVSPAAGTPRLIVGESEVQAESINPSGIATFRLEGLPPETSFEYQVWVGETASLSGRFRTFSRDPLSFRFVFGSCAKTGSNHSVFEVMEALDPLFILHMGDFHYENIEENEVARHLQAFDDVLASERQSSLYRAAPIAYVWDDHDYGPNNSDATHRGKPAALAAYDEAVPHYLLERADADDLPRDLHQAFTVGRVRLLLTDVRSHRSPEKQPDGPDKTMLGASQRKWLVQEITAAKDRYALVVWVNAVPWITEAGDGHGWGRYDWERRWIADRIRDAGMVDRILMLSGDAHMVAIDDGTHSNFASDAPANEPGFPVMHAAPLDRYPRHKGGPYSHGKAGRRVLFGLVPIQQFGLAEVHDDGDVLELTLSGRDGQGEELKGMHLGIRCDEVGCKP